MKSVLKRFLRDRGQAWLDSRMGGNDWVNCPEGRIELPMDVWVCKLDGEDCFLQACIPLDDREEFEEGCHAPEEKKEDVWDTVVSGKYEGFHHVPGRHLCVECERRNGSRSSFSYHYPWEIVNLGDVLYDMSDDELRKSIIENDFARPASGHGICPECCLDCVRVIRPDVATSLDVIEIEYSGR